MPSLSIDFILKKYLCLAPIFCIEEIATDSYIGSPVVLFHDRKGFIMSDHKHVIALNIHVRVPRQEPVIEWSLACHMFFSLFAIH